MCIRDRTYTVTEQKRESFDEFIEFVRNGEYANAVRELNDLRVQRKLGGGQDVIDQIDSILLSLIHIYFSWCRRHQWDLEADETSRYRQKEGTAHL